MIEKLNKLNLQIEKIKERPITNVDEYIQLLIERDEIKEQLNKEELNGRD